MAITQGTTQDAPKSITRPDELGTLYASLYPELRRYAWRLTRNDADAEDLVSQAFANTLAAVGAGKVLDRPRPWLYRCVLNEALDRKRRDLPEPLGEAPEVADHHSTAAAAELNERCAAINRAAGDLPDHLRQAFVLAEVRGLNYGEIATEMHRSVSSIRSLLARARTQVRAVAGNVQGLVAPVIGWVGTVAHGSGRRGRGSLVARQDQIQSWLGNWPTGGAGSLGKSVAAAALVVASLVGAGAGVQILRDNQSRPDGGPIAAEQSSPQGTAGSPAAGQVADAAKDGKDKAGEPGRPPRKDKDGDPSAISPERGEPGGPGPDSAGATQQAGSAAEGNSTGGDASPGTHRPTTSGTAFLPAPAGSSPSPAVAPAPAVPLTPSTQTAPAPAPAGELVPWFAPPAPVEEEPAPVPSGSIPTPHKPRPLGVRNPPKSTIGGQAAPGSPQ